ncbi:hypothetical protein POX_f07709 [Penicillium oxalicum]|uniref:Uncharacterized protein n=1 Tax=Penicillium oxalicum (strain 114-2 / CGMCC 5302) TaxID=933388 RepID=S7ZDA3_PENO1|nr:hypothetical protein POX_f07709 [Penicillium oxalicum]EPS28630.1 hypothetical protein PDE_03576 [Penicillium oxalicum 114-2]KAI2787346.1 hypothetical protein POX_f07709 [Penicillium oxalicum]
MCVTVSNLPIPFEGPRTILNHASSTRRDQSFWSFRAVDLVLKEVENSFIVLTPLIDDPNGPSLSQLTLTYKSKPSEIKWNVLYQPSELSKVAICWR